MPRRPLWLVLLAALFAGVTAAQPPEEEEEKKPAPVPAAPGKAAKPPRPVGVPPGEADPFQPVKPEEGEGEKPAEGDKPAAPAAVRFPDLVAEAKRATHPALKEYFALFPVAYDRLRLGLRAPVRVSPMPSVWGVDKYPKEFGVAIFDAENVLGEPTAVQLKSVAPPVEHLEQIAVEATDKLLALPAAGMPPPLVDRLVAAEKVLSSVYLFHGAAREQNRRKGKSWEPLGQAVYAKLGEVRVGRARSAAAARDWARLADLTARYGELYKAVPAVAEPLAAARLAEALVLAESVTPADLERARTLLADYDARFPGGKAPAAAAVRKALGDRARALLLDAERVGASDKGRARNLLETAERIDPANADLRARRQALSLGYPTLVVGARRRPELMSPARARFDSEKQAVELLFEGLLEAVPDDEVGVRFSLALAAARPTVGAGVRDATLVGSAAWGGPGAGGVTAADVTGTVRLLREVPHLAAAAPLAWLADPGLDPADPFHARMRLSRGHPDPRGLLTLKILPATWLLEHNLRADDETFARKPFGTGPYRLLPESGLPPAPDAAPPDVTFVANPDYARRPGKAAQPFIKEIQFTDAARLRDPAQEFRAGRLHVLTDVPTAELAKYTAENNLGNTVRVATAADPKRVHALLLNHRRPPLQNQDLRRGLSHAIDRDKILTAVFRAPAEPAKFHRALTGPYPPGSWLTPKPVGGLPLLFNRDLAATKLRGYLASPAAVTALTLAYPADDAQAALACEQIRQQVEAVTAADAQKLAVRLEPLSPADLVQRVTVEHRYDLAYLPVDYRDIFFPFALGGLLDPQAAGPGGRNAGGYLGPGTTPTAADLALGQTLAEIRGHRDPAGKLVPLAERAFRQFNDATPFVPLWELDRHTVISNAVKVRFPGETDPADPRRLDPTTLFTGVGEWRVE